MSGAAADLERVLDFLTVMDRLKSVTRSAYLTGEPERHENTAEHTWHMALYALLLHRHLGVECDLARALELILCHDLVEVGAGDCNVYDTAGRAARVALEEQAARELFGLLPVDLRDFVDGCWREFETGETPEARFARALDRLQAIAQNAATGGRAWREHGITEARSRELNLAVAARCPATLPAFEALYRRVAGGGYWAEPGA